MEIVNGILTCIVGNMPLAKVLHDYLVEHYPEQSERPSDVSLGVELDRWFCPGCGIRLRDLACPHCGRTIRPIHYALVERHPHRGEMAALKAWEARQTKRS